MGAILADLMRVGGLWTTHITNSMKYCHRLLIIFLDIHYLNRHMVERCRTLVGHPQGAGGLHGQI